MRLLGRLFRLLAVAGAFAIRAPVALFQLAVFLFLSAGALMIGLALFRGYVLGHTGSADPQGFWGWALYLALLAPLWALGIHGWAHRTGVAAWFHRPGDTHGSARFASPRETRALTRDAPGALLIGRDLRSGRLLRYDGPAHLLTLAPTRAGKGVGAVLPNLLTADRSVLVIDPKGENGVPWGSLQDCTLSDGLISLVPFRPRKT